MLIAPCGIESFAIFIESKRSATFTGNCTKAAAGIDILNAIDGRKFKAGLTWITEKCKGTGTNHGMVGNALGGIKITFQIGILHELDIAEISETFTTSRIARGINAGLQLNASQVLNGVAIFTTGEPAHGDTPRISVVFLGVGAQFGTDPSDRLQSFSIRRLGHFLWRHALLLQSGGHLFPMSEPIGDGIFRHQFLQIHATHGS